MQVYGDGYRERRRALQTRRRGYGSADGERGQPQHDGWRARESTTERRRRGRVVRWLDTAFKETRRILASDRAGGGSRLGAGSSQVEANAGERKPCQRQLELLQQQQ
ncbi:6-phosphofructo-2-kinase/fructose-2, 6-bisphosphatase-like [Iris pallida]|uniref:6-phosphofructo-2-kinase/fructose-2, 6-bisphosphatase-like n=1 Tax=Iris pallida TaxID=29817 RepID=A0AAX6G9V6_IRIPA|nr:6-phosphofructo-2-kinase/fructose-2, 6-bisphosphatase-like [Iris pallida]